MKKSVAIFVVSLMGLAAVALTLMAAWAPGGIPICNAPGAQVAVAAAGDGLGGAVVAWVDHRNYIWDQIYAQRISPNGATYWAGNGVPVCCLNTVHGGPAVVPDGGGGAIIAWHDTRAITGSSAPGIYMQRVNVLGNVVWPADGKRVTPHIGDANTEFSMTADGHNGIFLAYSDGGTILHAHLDAAGDGAWGWFSGGTYSNPQIVADTAGAFVLWEESYLGIRRHHVEHIDADGTYYSYTGFLLCDVFADQPSALLCADGLGHAIAVWEERRNGTDRDIYAQRIDSQGNWLWNSSGAPVCTLTGEQELKGVMPDGAGGAIIIFNNILQGIDYKSGVQGGDPGGVLQFTNYDVWAQRMSASGAPLWGANGITLCGTTGNQIDPFIAPAADGGAFVLWDDDRQGSYYGIYCQRVDANGMLQLGANGVPICAASQPTLSTLNPVAVSNDAGGVSVFWMDYRNGAASDVYGQGVDQWGGEPVVATLLQSFSASYYGSAVSVSWTLSAIDDGAGFVVLRTVGSSEDWREIPAAVTRSGLSFAFADRDAEPGETYRYRIDVRAGGKESMLFETQPIAIPASPLALSQNQPNPFNPSTSIRFYLPEKANVRLEVYAVSGARIAILADGVMDKGTHTVQWNGRDAGGRAVASGVYMCSLRAGKEMLTRKMVLTR
jgi:hypothetical protein